MPFKLKLKKTRQYNVASKSLFVISVELLDGSVADCTLSVDSTGQECLDNVCQRQAINQPEFFGLRYVNQDQQSLWVQLDRPLKKQLDKHASAHQLYLRIMYYIVSGTSLITDEVTRYHYFLQLKNDLIEGRIICDCQQAVILASYSRQAEYGNHDRERHTVDYLKNLLTFPKQMIDGGHIIESSSLAESGKLEHMTAAVIQHHMTLHNMSQTQAEEGFISQCQLLRGYGQEMFSAELKDHKRSEVTIAISLNGIMVLSENTDTPHFYRWLDITNVINHKRTFSVECAVPANSSSFLLSTPELGKYVWRLCVAQHTFYMSHQRENSEAGTQFQQEQPEPREDTDSSFHRLQPLSASRRAHSTSCLEQLNTQRQRKALLPQYRPAPDYETAIQHKYHQQRAEVQLRYQNPQMVANKPIAYGSHPDIHRIHYPDVTRHTMNQGTDDYYGLNYVGQTYPAFAVNPNVQTELNPQLRFVNLYKPPPPYPSNGLASNSTPDLAVASQISYHRNFINPHMSGSSPDLVSTRTAINRQYLGYLNGNVNVVNYNRPVMHSTHGTYNNLTSVLDVPKTHILMDVNDRQVYNERGEIVYSMMHRVPYQRHLMVSQKQIKDQEPIYENVPLPWQSERVTMRDRAQSLTTTDEINRLNERNSNSTLNRFRNLKPNTNVPNFVPPINIETPDYVNAQIIKGVRESSLPKDLNKSNQSIVNVELSKSVDLLSVDETPYQSLSTNKISNQENVTSITVTDSISKSVTISDHNSNVSQSSGVESALTNSTMNSTYSTSELESSNTTKSSVSSKEKKRRRWGVFMGRGTKTVDVKSATLGRDKAKTTVQPANKHRWSTGLPKFQPLPPSITKETLCQLLERKMSDNQLSFAFEQIPKGRESNSEMSIALLPENSHLNGYSSESLPYDDNRVKLQPTPANRHGYINASHVTMTVGSSQRFYVVCKVGGSPHPKLLSTGVPGAGVTGVGDALLWECVATAGARVVASGAGCNLPGVGQVAEYGKLAVKVESCSTANWGVLRRVKVVCGRPRDVWHLTLDWNKGEKLPSVEYFLAFLTELSSVRALWSSSRDAVCARNAPVVVCGGGGGGTGVAGVIVAADLLLHTLDTNQELDIPRTVSLLHQQRANLIEDVHQYKFLHQILLQYLKRSRLI